MVLQIDDLLKQRNEIHASYTVVPPMKRSSSKTKRSSAKESKEEGYGKEEGYTNEEGYCKEEGYSSSRERKSVRERLRKKKWFNIHLKAGKRKSC